MRRIECPDDCPHLHAHDPYRKGRLAEQFFTYRKGYLMDAYTMGGDDALLFLHMLDIVTYAEFYNSPDTPTFVILNGMEDVRQRLSPLYVGDTRCSNFGERLWNEIEYLINEKGYNRDLAKRLIEANMDFIRNFHTQGKGANPFLDGLIGFIETRYPEDAQNIRAQQTQRIIIPD